MERFFRVESNDFGIRTIKSGYGTSVAFKTLLNDELVELLSSELGIDRKFAMTVLFNNKILRCKVCGGYIKSFDNSSCGLKCSRQVSLHTLKSDTERFENFKKNTAKAVEKVWSEKTDAEMELMKERISEGMVEARYDVVRDGVSLKLLKNEMTTEERTVTFNYNPDGNIDVLREWYSNASKEELEKLYVVRADAIRRHERDPKDFDDYKTLVHSITDINYRIHIDAINPKRYKRGKGVEDYNLDHKVSIVECFNNDIAPEIAGSRVNLRKSHRSSMSIIELLTKYREVEEDL